MKNYQSVEEGTWVELLPVQLTKEQRDLMRSNKEEDTEAKQELSALIKSKKEGSVPTKKKNELKAFYNSVKPELKENDTYQLISINLSEKEDKFVGILNCRVNGEHKQIRF
jgi:hypothetical protein